MKYADVIPETLMGNQIYPYFDTLFCKSQWGFRKGFNAQHCLLVMIEKWRKTFDKGGETGAVLTDLSKAFDCIDYNLLIPKLDAYGFEKQSIDFLHLYLTKRKQRTKVDSAYGGNVTFRCPSKLYIRTTTIQYIYLRYVF